MHEPEEVVVEVKEVKKEFTTAQGKLTILENVSFSVRKGERVAIVGPSGSGKSTLLSLIGLLDTPSSGTITIHGVKTGALNEAEQAEFRSREIGFIFQSFELISPFTARENIMAPLEIGKQATSPEAAEEIMERLGIMTRAEALPETLSGGEKQRVAIGRALIHRPTLILADEPTGSLDRATGERVLALLLNATHNSDTTLIIITHDETVAKQMDRVFELRDKTLHERI
jgi:putative ABC transport system ATP-binding protein